MKELLGILFAVIVLAIYHPKFVLGCVLVCVLLFGLTMIILALLKNGGPPR